MLFRTSKVRDSCGCRYFATHYLLLYVAIVRQSMMCANFAQFHNSDRYTGIGRTRHRLPIRAVALLFSLRFSSWLVILGSILLLPFAVQVPPQRPQLFVAGFLLYRGSLAFAFTAYSSRHLGITLPFAEYTNSLKKACWDISAVTV